MVQRTTWRAGSGRRRRRRPRWRRRRPRRAVRRPPRGSRASSCHAYAPGHLHQPPQPSADLGPCDPLVPEACYLPYPNNFWLREDPSTATGYRVHLERETMPADDRGEHFDPAEWNTLDGFSASSAALAYLGNVDLSTLPHHWVRGLCHRDARTRAGRRSRWSRRRRAEGTVRPGPWPVAGGRLPVGPAGHGHGRARCPLCRAGRELADRDRQDADAVAHPPAGGAQGDCGRRGAPAALR